MKKSLMLVVSFMLVANSAFAGLDWKPIAAVTFGQMADAGVTWHQINTPALHCSEANPLFGAHPSTAKLLLPKIGVAALGTLLAVSADHAQSKGARRLGKTVAYIIGGFGGGLAVLNLHTCGW